MIRRRSVGKGMSIFFHEKEKAFHLCNDYISYLFRVMENGQLEQLYYGKRVVLADSVERFVERSYRPLSVCEFEDEWDHSLELIKQELPVSGSGDFREAMLEVAFGDGSYVVELTYVSHDVLDGKPKRRGMPATFAEKGAAETLVVRLADDTCGLQVDLHYTIFEHLPVVTRSVRVVNGGKQSFVLERLLSASVDLPGDGYEMLHLSGAWAKERHVYRGMTRPGVQAVKSVRGASSAMHNPFMALLSNDTTEHGGEVYGMNLVYSGNFLAQVEVDNYGMSRMMIGIHPERFQWNLPSGEAFWSPEAVLVYSDSGLNGMSQAFHDLYHGHLINPRWAKMARPVVMNNWEGTYFDFDEEKIVEMVSAASKLGVELFVLDDGWFGKRDDDRSSLGDWVAYKEKLPNGIKGLADRVRELGMQFGLWFEPEMVNEDSDLFRAHPDWVMGTPGRKRKHARFQYVLDFANPEVVDYVFTMMDKVIGEADIAYVKWDMNRNINDAYSVYLDGACQGEVLHRYILGVYTLYEKLLHNYPDLLIESCASGGGRFDPGMLYYAPQTWASDNSDAVERLKIQYGTSLVYPVSSMGAHVSASPNHQVGRVTSLGMRAAVAYFGAFGYELDPRTFSEEEAELVKEQISFYKEKRQLLLYGKFIRLADPFAESTTESRLSGLGDAGSGTAWMVVKEDQSEAIVGWYQVLARPNDRYKRLRLKGLDRTARYLVKELDIVYSGSELMEMGLFLSETLYSKRHGRSVSKNGVGEPVRGDYQARLFQLQKLD